MGLSQEDFAEQLGKQKTAISKYERSEIQPSAELLSKIGVNFGINLNWLLTGKGNMFLNETLTTLPQCRTLPFQMSEDDLCHIPKYDITASAGYGAYNSNEPLELISLDKEYVTKELKANYKALSAISVEGDSMEPTLRHGDVVLVDNSQTKKGEGVFIVRINDCLFVKRVQMLLDSDQPQIRLTSDNGFYEPMQVKLTTNNVAILGRVVACLRKM